MVRDDKSLAAYVKTPMASCFISSCAGSSATRTREHMFTFLRSIPVKPTDIRRRLRFVIMSGFALLALVLVVWLSNHVVIFLLSRSYVDQLAVALDVNKNLATAVFWGTFAVAALLTAYAISFSRRRRLLGLGGLLALLIGHSLILWLGTSGHFFERSGKPIKCYIVARDAIRYGEQPGIDPVSGRECRPVTPEIVESLNAYAGGARPHRLESSEPVFFEPRTGAAIVWYAIGANGQIELFDLMGFHPETGEELLPVGREVVQRWKAQNKERMRLEARRAPQRIDPEKYSLFDAITGEARVWYSRNEQGEFEFYDRSGFHQSAGERLEIVTRDIVDAWRKQASERTSQKCYVMTRDAVRFGDRTGIDPVTGRQCRPVTEELLERLREYEKGNRPKRIDAASPSFFDLRTGEPIVWYRANKDGVVELFDLMGFHPETGEELLPITREVADLWKRQTEEQKRRIPQRVDIGQYAPFDPLTGAPRVWYWLSEKRDYEFYDSAGFHPQTGEPLGLLTREMLAKREEELQQRRREEQQKAEADQRRIPQRVDIGQYAPFDPLTGAPRVWYWLSDKGDYEFYDSAGFHPGTGEPLSALTRDAIKKRDEEMLRREREEQQKTESVRLERQKRAEQEEQERRKREAEQQKRAEQEEQERRKREAEREREAQAAKLCNQLAGNPNDPRRAAEGVSYEVLRSHAKEAAEHCELAVKRFPSELRLQYQLARALQFVDRQKAFEAQKRLVELKYPAAFDNAGWLYISQDRNYAQAGKLFRMGAQLGDPDCMMSLAELIEKGYATPSNANETTAALYARAAQLGHPRAQEKLEGERESAARDAQDRRRQEEGERQMWRFIGPMIRSIPAR